MKLTVLKGATSQTVYLFIRDSSSTTGSGLTGLAYNSGSLVASYVRPLGSRTAITLATQTVTGAWSSGGFVEVDATNMPGIYRLDVPDAVFASGVNSAIVMLKGAANMEPSVIEFALEAVNAQDAVRGGMTALPNANAEAAGGLYTRGTGAGQINQTNNGQIDANAARTGGTTNTGRDIGASVLLSSGTGAGQISLSSGLVTLAGVTHTGAVIPTVTTLTGHTAQTGDAFARLGAPAGASVSADVAAVKTDTGNLVTRITSTLFSGITSMAQWLGLLAGKQTGNSTARTELRATGAGSGTFDETTDSQEALRDRGDAAWTTATGFSTLDAAGVRAAVGLASANLDSQLDALPTAAENADAVWDEAISGHLTSGTTGAALNAAGSSGDPWSTPLPGAYGSGTAGKIIGDNINATISSRAAASVLGAAVGASISADIAAVKSQTAAIETDTQDIQNRLPASLVSGRIDASVGAMAANVMTAAAAAADLTTELQSGLATASALATVAGYIDTEVAAIKAKTDNLPSDPADASDIAGAFSTVNGTLATIAGYIDTEVAAIKAKTDLIPASPAAVGDIPTATQNADALLNRDMGAVSDTNARSPLNALRFLRNKWAIGGSTLSVKKEDDSTEAWNAQVSTTPGADPVTGNDPA